MRSMLSWTMRARGERVGSGESEPYSSMLQRPPGHERAGDDPPAPVTSLARPSAVAPFRTRSFRFQWPADLLTSWALEMEMLILGWYVLAETGSVMWLTVFAALLNIGTLVAPMFGVVGDRISQ